MYVVPTSSNLGKLLHNGDKRKLVVALLLLCYSSCFLLQRYLRRETAALAYFGEKLFLSHCFEVLP
jgi:hypothetical protein